MINKIIGNYSFGTSFLHKLDPRTKIIGLILVMIGVFSNGGFFGYFLLFSGVITLFVLSEISLLILYESIKFLRYMFIILLIINSLILTKGNLLFEIPYIGWKFYEETFVQTFYIFSRVFLMLAFSIILTSTTKPLTLAMGIEKLLSPLKIFKVNVEVFSMMISISLRFIPTLFLETQHIMNAQSARGLDFKHGKFKHKLKAIMSLIIPLLISSFNKADELALSMEAKNYNPVAKRTRYRIINLKLRDVITLFLIVILLFSYLYFGSFLRSVWGI